MNTKSLAIVLFCTSMVFFHYHSTFHFIWALVGVPFEFPLDPVEGWWALLKGFLPMFSLFLAFYAGIINKPKRKNNGLSI